MLKELFGQLKIIVKFLCHQIPKISHNKGLKTPDYVNTNVASKVLVLVQIGIRVLGLAIAVRLLTT